MILLNIPPIVGNSQIDDFPKWISCTSSSWSIEREFTEASKAGSQDLNTGVAELQPIELEKNMDNASVDLMAYSINGKALDEAEIVFLETLEDKTERYLEFKLGHVVVKSWSISGSDDDRPTESFSLWYQKIQMKYTNWLPDNTKGATPQKSWNTVKNTPTY